MFGLEFLGRYNPSPTAVFKPMRSTSGQDKRPVQRLALRRVWWYPTRISKGLSAGLGKQREEVEAGYSRRSTAK